MTVRVTTIPADADADERQVLTRVADLARRPEARLVEGTESVALPNALRQLAELAGETLAHAVPLVVVAADAEVSPADAAKLLGVTRQYVDRLIAGGALPARRLPGSRYRKIPVQAVMSHREDHVRNLTPSSTRTRDRQPGPPASNGRAVTARGRERRERLIAATAQLVADRGFHAVGIAEMGAAAGVTGAAIYRHFANKTQLLVAVFDQVVDELLAGSAQIIASELAPTELLETLVRHHVRLVLRNPAVFGVYIQEAHNLPVADRSRLRRNQRAYVLRWSEVLKMLRVELGEDDARTRVQATFGLLNSLANFPSTLPPGQLAELLTSMALASLRAEDAPPASLSGGPNPLPIM